MFLPSFGQCFLFILLFFFYLFQISMQLNLWSVLEQTWQYLSYKTLYKNLLSHLFGTKFFEKFSLSITHKPFTSLFSFLAKVIYTLKKSYSFDVCIYCQESFWRCQRQEMRHKHSYNETCDIYWFFKMTNNYKTKIIFLILLSLLFVQQDVKTWQEQTSSRTLIYLFQ